MIYISTACSSYKKLREVLNQYAELGIQNIELSGGTKYYPELEIDLRNLQEKFNFKYAFHGYFPPPKEDFVINLASCNESIYQKSIEHYEKCIQLMVKVKALYLSIHAGFLTEILPAEISKKISKNIVYDKEEAMERFCSAYSHIEKIAKKHGIKLYLENNVLNADNYARFENEKLMLMTDFDSFMEIYQKIPCNLLLDLGHLKVSCRTFKLDFDEQIRKFKPYVNWVHLSNNNGQCDEHKCLIKSGDIINGLELIDGILDGITIEVNEGIKDVLNSYTLVEQVETLKRREVL